MPGCRAEGDRALFCGDNVGVLYEREGGDQTGQRWAGIRGRLGLVLRMLVWERVGLRHGKAEASGVATVNKCSRRGCGSM